MISHDTDGDVLCPIVGAVDLGATLGHMHDDLLFMMHVTEPSEAHITRADHTQVRMLFTVDMAAVNPLHETADQHSVLVQ